MRACNFPAVNRRITLLGFIGVLYGVYQDYKNAEIEYKVKKLEERIEKLEKNPEEE